VVNGRLSHQNSYSSRGHSPRLGKSASLPHRYDSPGGTPSSASRLAVLETLVDGIESRPRGSSKVTSPAMSRPDDFSSPLPRLSVQPSASASQHQSISIGAAASSAKEQGKRKDQEPGGRGGGALRSLLVGVGLGVVAKVLADKREENRQEKLRIEYLKARALERPVFMPDMPKPDDLVAEFRKFFEEKMGFFERLKCMLEGKK
jgi:hypothetical protein